MVSLNDITLTSVHPPIIVLSGKGHRHVESKRKYYALSLCYGGQITYTMNGKTYVSVPGTVVILPKNGAYSLVGDKEGIFPVLNFDCEENLCDTITVLPLSNPDACLRDCENLQRLFLFPENRLRIFSAFYELLNKVFRNQRPQENLLYPAIRYIEQNISDPNLSNTVLAGMIGFSEVYFRKLFSQHYGITPRQYILNARIQQAKQLLTTNRYSITKLAEVCGFSSVYHFCRAFKQHTGTTPTQYAKQHATFQI